MFKRLFIIYLAFSNYLLKSNMNDLFQLSSQLNALSNINFPVQFKDLILDGKYALVMLDKIKAKAGLSFDAIDIIGSNAGYYVVGNYINDFFKGTRNTYTLNSGFRPELVENYKIHLMPKSLNDLEEILILLLVAIKKDEKLADSIYAFKYRKNVNFGSIDKLKNSITFKGELMPILVIYPASSKEASEYLLNSLLKISKDIKGIDMTPRYNKKITSLVYYAQGDGDYKSDGYKKYYDEDRVFYRKDFEGEGLDKNYELQIDPKFGLKT